MKTFIGWQEIYNRLEYLKSAYEPDTKYYGVPRGGQIIAGMLGNAVDNISQADVIVDDLIDSGQTLLQYAKHDKPLLF